MWPDPATTQELLAQIRAGRPGAVDALLARHREPLRRLIGLRLDPALAGRVDASDVVQEVLFEASRRLDAYLRQPALPFHLWLRQMGQDHLIDAHRRHRLAQKRALDRERPLHAGNPGQSSFDLAARLVDPEPTPASAAVQGEMHRRLAEAVEALDEVDREVIVLRHVEQLSNQETALALGLTEPAASMRYLRALRRLKALVTPGGPEEASR